MNTRPSGLSAPRAPRAALVLAVVGLLVLAGCGSSKKATTAAAPASETGTSASQTGASSSQASGGGHSLSLATNGEGQLKFDTTSLSAAPGAVTIKFTNMAPLGHNLTVASSSGAVVGAVPTFQGGTKTLSLNLKPGVYKMVEVRAVDSRGHVLGTSAKLHGKRGRSGPGLPQSY